MWKVVKERMRRFVYYFMHVVTSSVKDVQYLRVVEEEGIGCKGGG